MDEHRFQIHLGGIIDLLSNHLYSSPSVYVRELLQNATDAIRARAQHEGRDASEGRVRITIGEGATPMLTVEDDGIGLTEDEVHRFLATIGASSKREEVEERRRELIGQFGIGLLSAFVVSDEISVLTRSAKGGPAISWRGRADGSYVIEKVEGDTPVGTTVHLVAKDGAHEWFDVAQVSELAGRFGALLPFPVEITSSAGTARVNDEPPPWKRRFESASDARDAALAFGRKVLGADVPFFDVLPLKTDAGGVEGLAFVLPYSPPPTAPAAHRVYLKGMLLSEKADNLLPRWAFFVTCVLDAQALRPTASRESFYEDDALERARDALGGALRAYLMLLREHDPQRLELLITLHFRAIKALASQDDELLALFLDLLPFETSLGRMSFASLRKRQSTIRYASTVDVFRQIAQVAAAQGVVVVNAGYSYDADLLQRAPQVFSDLTVEAVDATDLSEVLGEVGQGAEVFETLIAVADEVLAPHRCGVDLKRFEPRDLPVLYVSGEDASFQRTIEQSKRATGDDGLWAGVLDGIAEETRDAKAYLVFNAANPLVGRLARTDDEDAMRLSIPMLYVQALLLGHHPLSPEELALLNVGLLDLIEWGLAKHDEGPTLN
ncbi:MAG: HSP90 family protein [Sandaracinus sp.]|nr:HSP90 family protein [Sandaracinus sp.]